MKLILFGLPGAGKGTIARLISSDYKVPHISTGDLLREQISKETEIGKEVQKYLEEGDLAPDGIVLNLLKTRLAFEDCENGYIIDGYPRTLKQSKDLFAEGIEVDKLLFLNVSNEEVINRISARRACKKCANLVNLNIEDTLNCPKCNGALITRHDDKPEIVEHRLKLYRKTALPLLEYYEKHGYLNEIDASKTLDENYNTVKKILEQKD